MPKVPRHCHQVNCFQQGMLEFEGHMGQCFSRFPTVSSWRRGKKRKKDTGLTGRVYLSVKSIEMKIEITTLLESVSLSERFLKV